MRAMGKGWAKGLTAATDPRVARMAATRRGRRRGAYARKGEGSSTPVWEWTPDTAYAVGLLATDGNLSSSGRHISLSSKDREQLLTFLRCVRRTARIGAVRGGFGTTSLRVQLGDVGLYRWLASIGLHPRKSHTLAAIAAPDAVFPHLLRGLLDGDGSIIDVTYEGTGKAAGRRYRTLLVRFISASRPHVAWLQQRIHALFGLSGSVTATNGIYRLTFAKSSSLRLLEVIYPGPDVPCLARKREIWIRFVREGGVLVGDPAVQSTSPPR